MACITLACKIEEAHPPRRVRDIINVFEHIKQVRNGRPIKPVILDANYISLKNNVIKKERQVLKELGFCVHIKHPHKLVVMYMQFLGFQADEKFVQMSWNFMNDSLRTDCFVRYQPETIACACIYLSARKLGIPLPRKPAWWVTLYILLIMVARLWSNAWVSVFLLRGVRLTFILLKKVGIKDIVQGLD